MLPSMAGRTLALCPGADRVVVRRRRPHGVLEVPDRFDHELAGLARNGALMTTNTTLAGQCDRPTFVVVRQACDLLHVARRGAET